MHGDFAANAPRSGIGRSRAFKLMAPAVLPTLLAPLGQTPLPGPALERNI